MNPSPRDLLTARSMLISQKGSQPRSSQAVVPCEPSELNDLPNDLTELRQYCGRLLERLIEKDYDLQLAARAGQQLLEKTERLEFLLTHLSATEPQQPVVGSDAIEIRSRSCSFQGQQQQKRTDHGNNVDEVSNNESTMRPVGAANGSRDQRYVEQLEQSHFELQEQVEALRSRLRTERLQDRQSIRRLQDAVTSLSQQLQSKDTECADLQRQLHRLAKQRIQEFRAAADPSQQPILSPSNLDRPAGGSIEDTNPLPTNPTDPMMFELAECRQRYADLNRNHKELCAEVERAFQINRDLIGSVGWMPVPTGAVSEEYCREVACHSQFTQTDEGADHWLLGYWNQCMASMEVCLSEGRVHFIYNCSNWLWRYWSMYLVRMVAWPFQLLHAVTSTPSKAD